MVKIRARVLMVALWILALVLPVQAQRSGPAVPENMMLPDLRVYDATGRPFSLTGLRGSYSVLVFGCLT